MIRPYVLKKHRTATSIVKASLERELVTQKCEDITIAPHASCPDDGAFTYEEFLTTIRRQGRWAFVRLRDRDTTSELHYWAGKKCTDIQFAEMLAHELGHLSEEPLDDDAAEEDRADAYASVAVTAIALMCRR